MENFDYCLVNQKIKLIYTIVLHENIHKQIYFLVNEKEQKATRFTNASQAIKKRGLNKNLKIGVFSIKDIEFCLMYAFNNALDIVDIYVDAIELRKDTNYYSEERTFKLYKVLDKIRDLTIIER